MPRSQHILHDSKKIRRKSERDISIPNKEGVGVGPAVRHGTAVRHGADKDAIKIGMCHNPVNWCQPQSWLLKASLIKAQY